MSNTPLEAERRKVQAQLDERDARVARIDRARRRADDRRQADELADAEAVDRAEAEQARHADHREQGWPYIPVLGDARNPRRSHKSRGKRSSWSLKPQPKSWTLAPPRAKHAEPLWQRNKRLGFGDDGKAGRPRSRKSLVTRAQREHEAETRDANLPVEVRKAGKTGMPTLSGHFAVFDSPTEISDWDGSFIEEMAAGSFAKTISENRDLIRCLLSHGRDPSVGEKPLGPVEELREDATGVFYEVPLIDVSYNHDLAPAVEKELYGASFKFRAIREEVDDEPGTSAGNPKGLPIRRVLEVELFEFGPTPFGAYPEATTGVAA
jgi:HK97 family phage prohead protease